MQGLVVLVVAIHLSLCGMGYKESLVLAGVQGKFGVGKIDESGKSLLPFCALK